MKNSIKRETLTPEEYKKKLQELREERDNLRRRADIIDKEMDTLESDEKLADFTIGKYIKVDRTSKGGYIEYFHVDSWQKEPRGVALRGKGYSDSPGNQIRYFHTSDTLRLTWDEMNDPVEISEDEFIERFDKRAKDIREYLLDYKTYPARDDGFKFKNAVIEGKVKAMFKNEDGTITDLSSDLNNILRKK